MPAHCRWCTAPLWLTLVPVTQQPVGLFYFAGHGSVQNGRQVLAIGTDQHLDFKQHLLRVLAATAPRAIQFVILDCMHCPRLSARTCNRCWPRQTRASHCRHLHLLCGPECVGRRVCGGLPGPPHQSPRARTHLARDDALG
jgi:hypothetical protein